MIIISKTKPAKDEQLLNDIYKEYMEYWNLFGTDGFSSRIILKVMPFSKGYFELPYWLVYKINYMLGFINDCILEKEQKN